MKKIKYVILFIFVLACCGCGYKYASITRTIRHSGFNVAGNSFKCSSIFDKKDETINDKVRFYIGNYIITENGNIYETSLSKVYSNDMNCKRPDFDKKVYAIFDLSIIKAEDNKYYYVGGSEDVPSYSEVTTADEDYSLYDVLLKDKSVIKVSTINAKEGLYYVLKSDGNIYQYRVLKGDNKVSYLDSSILLYDKNDYDSDIIDFNYNGSSSTTFIRTDNHIFRMKITNSEKCYKYVDISCNYEMKEDDNLTKVRDRILAYNGSTLITTYGSIFNVNN